MVSLFSIHRVKSAREGPTIASKTHRQAQSIIWKTTLQVMQRSKNASKTILTRKVTLVASPRVAAASNRTSYQSRNGAKASAFKETKPSTARSNLIW